MTPFHDLHDYLALPRLTGLRLAPDGSWLAVTVSALAPDGAGGLRKDVVVIDTGTGERRDLLSEPGFDFTAPRVSPDGKRVVAIRERHESYGQARALTVVMVELDDASRSGGASGGQAETQDLLPGRLEEVEAAAADGTPLRAWLVLPGPASPDTPVPLLLWVHGGPYSSWNSWSWRWNPWLMAARGYAVLLPDPGLSTGYGHEFVARGHGDKDYRVPVGEALRLWTDLAARPGHLAGSKFLYFPDENHWVLAPGNSRIWYETVFAFLAQHVLGEPWQRPTLV